MKVKNWFERKWYSKSIASILLLPFSYLYLLGFLLHKHSYSFGLKKKFNSPIPVIVVGNLTVGGTGKTPFTISLCKDLMEHGYRPAIITRGFKGKATKIPQWITRESDPYLVGDEAVLLAAKTRCPVVASPNRTAAIKMLIEKKNCDIIVSDDGLQHHAINKEIEIVLVDGIRKFGNGWCLPAGPLREPLRKLRDVDFILYKDQAPANETAFQILPGDIYNLQDPTRRLHTIPNQHVHALAAIGHPEHFFSTLESKGFQCTTHCFPDHHHFTEDDFNFAEDAVIIMTEKDAVKCGRFANDNCWVLPIEVKIPDLCMQGIRSKLSALKT